MRYLAWVVMAIVFLGTFAITEDLMLSFGAELLAVFFMLIFGKQFFFGHISNPDQKED